MDRIRSSKSDTEQAATGANSTAVGSAMPAGQSSVMLRNGNPNATPIDVQTKSTEQMSSTTIPLPTSRRSWLGQQSTLPMTAPMMNMGPTGAAMPFMQQQMPMHPAPAAQANGQMNQMALPLQPNGQVAAPGLAAPGQNPGIGQGAAMPTGPATKVVTNLNPWTGAAAGPSVASQGRSAPERPRVLGGPIARLDPDRGPWQQSLAIPQLSPAPAPQSGLPQQ